MGGGGLELSPIVKRKSIFPHFSSFYTEISDSIPSPRFTTNTILIKWNSNIAMNSDTLKDCRLWHHSKLTLQNWSGLESENDWRNQPPMPLLLRYALGLTSHIRLMCAVASVTVLHYIKSISLFLTNTTEPTPVILAIILERIPNKMFYKNFRHEASPMILGKIMARKILQDLEEMSDGIRKFSLLSQLNTFQKFSWQNLAKNLRKICL